MEKPQILEVAVDLARLRQSVLLHKFLGYTRIEKRTSKDEIKSIEVYWKCKKSDS